MRYGRTFASFVALVPVAFIWAQQTPSIEAQRQAYIRKRKAEGKIWVRDPLQVAVTSVGLTRAKFYNRLKVESDPSTQTNPNIATSTRWTYSKWTSSYTTRTLIDFDQSGVITTVTAEILKPDHSIGLIPEELLVPSASAKHSRKEMLPFIKVYVDKASIEKALQGGPSQIYGSLGIVPAILVIDRPDKPKLKLVLNAEPPNILSVSRSLDLSTGKYRTKVDYNAKVAYLISGSTDRLIAARTLPPLPAGFTSVPVSQGIY